MDIPKEIEDFAMELFKQNYKLYVVGGYVRDHLLGICPKDMDICGNIPLEIVAKTAKICGFSCVIIQRELGTLQLKKDNIEAEYTRFRREQYENGSHCPKTVEWVDDLTQDALRRDFSVNAIYYDIMQHTLADPCQGQEDLRKKLIRTVDSPGVTLSRDGLRILRAVRFAEQLQFEIEKKTEKACKDNVYLLRDISKERVTDELRKIFYAYQKCGQNIQPYKIVHRLNRWCIWPQILPTISFRDLPLQRKVSFCSMKNKNKRLTTFYSNVYKVIPQELGYLAFLLMLVMGDIGEVMTESSIRYSTMKVLGTDGLKETKQVQSSVQKLLLCMYRLEGYDTILTFKQFAIVYHSYSLEEKDILHLIDNEYFCRVEAEYLNMKMKNIPFTPSKLAISPKQLEELGYNGKSLGQVLQLLWVEVLLENLPNEEEKLLAYLENKK